MNTSNSPTAPKVEIDPSLDNLHERKFVVEKLKRANEAIAKYGLPKEYYISQGLTPPDSKS